MRPVLKVLSVIRFANSGLLFFQESASISGWVSQSVAWINAGRYTRSDQSQEFVRNTSQRWPPFSRSGLRRDCGTSLMKTSALLIRRFYVFSFSQWLKGVCYGPSQRFCKLRKIEHSFLRKTALKTTYCEVLLDVCNVRKFYTNYLIQNMNVREVMQHFVEIS